MYIFGYLYPPILKSTIFLKKKVFLQKNENESSTLLTSFVLLVFQCEKLLFTTQQQQI